ncbi:MULTISPECIES: bifunctional aspartate kinase/homoserine dehydrogenase II [Idiomarina]|uniref:bifunctional aspartate kinase/homoserine dehydrogenase II n=1 Tax=Idiomarina TaxID=135575 RepID=UPI00129B195D|nr:MULTISPECIES: bifunctional aspartate kinase/homoserine dehydrogenase II [Idiomarina]MRJ41689.1 bifunctional aspartate kinase/homoserine dehydrogenase II [Idiomarina sp. FeN1]NCU57679.1 bifunctional aspartate kinase/homoserine dehydrogenase II [Idiomarina sp. FenA--70]NCU60231.1 bifunctional aspartate kinase/homoserine dehydrogenase II [Idiomarina sp. FenBw--71]UUN13423.1 bifunctional aspartate kinase/homoserine dehydrogenase II [Idiomarina loihiensis]
MTVEVKVTPEQIQTVAEQVQVHKFGGSSLADAYCYRRVARIVSEYAGASDLVVVSAAGDTTNRILAIIDAKADDRGVAEVLLKQLEKYQQGLINELLNGDHQQRVLDLSQQDFKRWYGWLNDQEVITHKPELLSYGELWSARLLAALLQQQGVTADYIDARTFLVAEDAPEPLIQVPVSRAGLLNRIAPHPGTRFIVTGFICADPSGRSLILGRNGSDYSATLVGSLIDSKQVTIWKDVAGVYSADPRKVERVVSLPILDWQEAEELARLGSPVLHPRTFQPVNRERMVIAVRSSLKVENQQTRIGLYEDTEAKGKVLTSLADVVLFRVDLSDAQLIDKFENLELTPLISWNEVAQHHAYYAYHQNHLDFLQQWLLEVDKADHVVQMEGYSMIALVGNRIQETAQYSTFKTELSAQNLRRLAFSPDNNAVIAILEQKLDNRLLNRIHSQLFNYRRSLGVLVVGRGNIGSAWLALYRRLRERINEQMDVRIIGILNSKQMWLDYNGLDLNDWEQQFDQFARPYEMSQLIPELPNAPYDELVMLDLTDAIAVAQLYPSFFANGLHIISANKRAGASGESQYNEIRTIQREYEREWYYNTTVGAGLPLNYALNDLRNSGDTIRSISGIFSGTMSWLFENFNAEVNFSDLVREAKVRGLSEPDPREDLSCQDIIRKMLILAREIGLRLDWQDIDVDSLLPESLADISLDEFMQRLPELDAGMHDLYLDAQKTGKVPRLLASFAVQDDDSVRARVGIEYIPEGDMLANLIPGENIFVIYTDWYHEMPLVISGPGAGKEVTAGGVQSDLNQLLSRLISQR